MQANEILHAVLTSAQEPIEQERQDLARAAKEVLGYKQMAKVLLEHDTLASTLRKLNIAPLVDSSVEEYKLSKEWNGMWEGHKRAYKCFAHIPFFLLMTGFIDHFIPNQHLTAFQTVLSVTCLLLVIAAVISLFLGIALRFDSDARGSRRRHRWTYNSLQGYSGNVPEFALAKALSIKRELSNVEFYVEYLQEETERTVKRLKDPFLYALYNDEKYYLDVWDEKEYERKM